MKSPESRPANIVPQGELEYTALESEIIQTIRTYEEPLLKKAWNKWSDQPLSSGQNRGWLICGMACTTMARIINYETHMPILENADAQTEQHLRIGTYFYDPHAPGGEITYAIDHTVVQAFNGQGQVLHIDVSGELLHGSKKGLTGNDDLRGAIHIARFEVDEYTDALQNSYHLYPLDFTKNRVQDTYRKFGTVPDHNDSEALDAWIKESQVHFRDWQSAKHDDRVTGPFPFIGNSGTVIDDNYGYGRFGPPLNDFVRQLLPGWTGITSSPGH